MLKAVGRWLDARRGRRGAPAGEWRFAERGENVQLEGGFFHDAQAIVLGDHIHVGADAVFWGTGGLTIENNVVIGPRCRIYTFTHRLDRADMLPYDAVTLLQPVHIGANVWINADVIIGPGVSIGEGAVVALGAVVTEPVPALAIVRGNPAAVVGYRDREHYQRLKLTRRFYLQLKAEDRVFFRRVHDEAELDTP